MGMYDRILVPTDGSAEMRPVLEHAAELATVHDADVHAVYALNTATFASLPMETSWEGVTTMLGDEGERALSAAREVADERGVPVVTELVEGSPSRQIVEYAEREGCDIVVMGTHGRGGIDRLLLGSVAERVVRASTVPVLTVRVGDTSERDPERERERESATDAVEATE